MAARYDGIHGSDQVAALGKIEQRRVVADTQDHSRLLPRLMVTDEETTDHIKLAEIGWRQITPHSAGRPYSCGLDSWAARSSTALTNLCPSVAPNCLVSCTASASATR